jgi:NAD(P)-dependent dehydrogenase (short-subunit alcohol dehydrogenase family)
MSGNRSSQPSTVRRLAPAAVALSAILGIREAVGRLREVDLAGQVVLVTGASRGLGLALAREFHAQGCRLAICARDPAELNRAAELLRGEGAEVHAVVCDVGDREAVAELIADVTRRYGRIDVLVNNAGLIQLGPVQTTEPKDYRTSLDVMTFGILYPTLAVLPQMQARRAGRIVNITSFGGKVPFPHMLPYTTAKFAAVGLSEGLRVELAAQGIAVHTVCPGPLRTGSHLAAYASGDERIQEEEYRWFAGGGASPFVVAADRAARTIVRGVRRGDPEIVFPTSAALLILLHGLSPGLTGDLLSLVNRYLLPEAPAPGAATESVRGMEIEPRFAGSRLWRTLTALGRRDAARLNQYPGTRQPIDDAAPAAQPARQREPEEIAASPPLRSDHEAVPSPNS